MRNYRDEDRNDDRRTRRGSREDYWEDSRNPDNRFSNRDWYRDSDRYSNSGSDRRWNDNAYNYAQNNYYGGRDRMDMMDDERYYGGRYEDSRNRYDNQSDGYRREGNSSYSSRYNGSRYNQGEDRDRSERGYQSYGNRGGWFGESNRGSQPENRRWNDEDMRSRNRHTGRGWYGDSEGHSEAAERGWDRRR